MDQRSELVVPETGEIIDLPPGKIELKPKLEILSFDGMSTLKLNNEQITTLMADIPKEDLDILPTGEVYASQVRYRNILNETFGPAGWGLRPISPLAIKDNQVFREYALMVNGIIISTAIGEQEYFPNNSRMTYATAAESAKSSALVRCCKDLGIASECWDRKFCQEFKKEHCIEVYRTKKGKKEWRRKDSEPFFDEGKAKTGGTAQEQEIVDPGASQTPPQQEFGHDLSDKVCTDKQVKMIIAIKMQHKVPQEVIDEFLQNRGKFTLSSLTSKEINELKNIMEAKK